MTAIFSTSLAACGAAYLVAARAGAPWPRWRAAAFLAGLVAALVALVLAEGSLPVHMAGHALLVAVAAPLLVLGRPLTLTLRALPAPRSRRLVRFLRTAPLRLLTHPYTAWIAFVGVQLAFHLTPLFTLTLRIEWVHALEHVAFAASAILFWTVALGTEPLERRLAPPAGSLYLWLAMPVNDAAGAYLMATGHQAAGGVMILGMMPLGAAAVALAWRWIAGEERRVRLREAR